nr:MAG TPA: hypothetical protein [Caudoviricetes sp.]
MVDSKSISNSTKPQVERLKLEKLSLFVPNAQDFSARYRA